MNRIASEKQILARFNRPENLLAHLKLKTCGDIQAVMPIFLAEFGKDIVLAWLLEKYPKEI